MYALPSRAIRLCNLIVTRLLFTSMLVLTAGCWARPDIPFDDVGSVDWSAVDAATERAAFERLNTLNRDVFDQAWATLAPFAHSQSRSVSVRDEDGVVVGRATRTIHISGPASRRTIRVVASDSSGSFERSLWSRFDNPGMSDVANEGLQMEWSDLVLPHEPLFLSDRGPSFFRYAVIGDTLIESLSVTIFEIAVRPETSRQGIQWAKIYLHETSLVGVEILVTQRSTLYLEVSNFRIMLSPISSGEWLPRTVALSSTVGLPFARSRSFEMQVVYSDIREQ